MTIARVTAVWRGFRGAPGYSNFYFQGDNAIDQPGDEMAAAVADFFRDMNALFPTDVNITIQPTVDNIDETTGALVGQQDITVPNGVPGGSTGTYSAASGAVVNWMTGAYRNGRRVRGRTFLVPLASNVYDSAGDLTGAALGTIRSAAADLIAAADTGGMVVWSRPRTTGGGSIHPVTSALVPDLGAILRSRRD